MAAWRGSLPGTPASWSRMTGCAAGRWWLRQWPPPATRGGRPSVAGGGGQPAVQHPAAGPVDLSRHPRRRGRYRRGDRAEAVTDRLVARPRCKAGGSLSVVAQLVAQRVVAQTIVWEVPPSPFFPRPGRTVCSEPAGPCGPCRWGWATTCTTAPRCGGWCKPRSRSAARRCTTAS